MRYIFLISIFLLVTQVGLSQRIDTIYYNADGNQVTEDSFDYYRIAIQKDSVVRVVDYDKKGNIKTTGAFKTFDFIHKTGPFFYFKKDKVYQLQIHEPSKYQKVLDRYGNYLEHIPKQSDSLMVLIHFKKEKVQSIGYSSGCCSYHGIWLYFTKKGILWLKAEYLNDVLHGEVVFYINGIPLNNIQYKNGRKDGVAYFYDKEGKLKRIKHYKNGKVEKDNTE